MCTVKFEGGAELTAKTNLTVVAKPSGEKNRHFTTLQNQSCRDAHYQNHISYWRPMLESSPLLIYVEIKHLIVYAHFPYF